jgi:[ribosomal protein S5]-alanine N-acetyltransferase
MFEIQTRRLRLIPLPLTCLQALQNSRLALDTLLGLAPSAIRVPADLKKEMPAAITLCLERVAEFPEDYAWHSLWDIVIQNENRAIGTMGLAGRPNEDGEVFTGYWIDERYRNRGFMTEALQGLSAWSFQDPAVQSVTANTPADNIASHRVLIKNGFQRKGELQGHPFWVLPRVCAEP